jgi:N-acylneuraminate cytidylyltransferase
VAYAAESIDAVVVTTDSDAIAEVAQDHGASLIPRPPHLATDDALVIDAIRHAVGVWSENKKPVDMAVLLEPTCPFRSVEDIEACLMRLQRDASLDSVATFTDAVLNPHRAWRLEEDRPEPFIEGAVPWRPRQALPDAYQLNGGVYAFWADRLPEDAVAPLFGQAGAVYMPAERSVDIDTELDLKLANLMVSDDMLERTQ